MTNRNMNMKRANDRGSIELIVLGLLAALIVVLAIPLLTSMGSDSDTVPSAVTVDAPAQEPAK